MTELLQFSLLDMTPYDRRSWFNLVGDYNQAIWFVYPVALFITFVLLRLMFATTKLNQHHCVRWSLFLLSLTWLWVGLVFHQQYFANLNWAATWFASAFVFQASLLLVAALLLKSVTWVSLSFWRGRLAILLLFLGLFIYPLSGFFEGRNYQQLEWFPLMPAPLVMVTVAFCLLLNTRWRYLLLLVPIVWAIVSAAFAMTLGLLEFYFMAVMIALCLLHAFLRASKA